MKAKSKSNQNLKKVNISNKLVWAYVKNLKPFQGSNLFAEFNCYGTYIVYSYGYHFPILACIDNKWFSHLTKRSCSTSKHLNLICFGLTNIIKIENISKFKKFLSNGGKI